MCKLQTAIGEGEGGKGYYRVLLKNHLTRHRYESEIFAYVPNARLHSPFLSFLAARRMPRASLQRVCARGRDVDLMI